MTKCKIILSPPEIGRITMIAGKTNRQCQECTICNESERGSGLRIASVWKISSSGMGVKGKDQRKETCFKPLSRVPSFEKMGSCTGLVQYTSADGTVDSKHERTHLKSGPQWALCTVAPQLGGPLEDFGLRVNLLRAVWKVLFGDALLE